MMTRRNRWSLFLMLALCLATAAWGQQKKTINIVATNDMHASIDVFPQLGAIVDSLRAADPSLLVFSAGDNRTGNPINDMYDIPNYPVAAIMNQIGYNASAIGNHEFDLRSLPVTIPLSNFRYLCANIQADDTTGVRTIPYQVFDVEGIRVAVLGAIQLNYRGFPDTHPDNLKGLSFTQPEESIAQYEWLRQQSDVVILLSHVGYEADLRMANRFPWIDLIIGGHTHTQLSNDEPLHNGILVTQNANNLPKATHITLTLDSGRVVGKQANYIDVKNYPRTNPILRDMVRMFNDNPFFHRVVGEADEPFASRQQLGYMLCDALREGTDADIAIFNQRGVRLTSLPKGDITMKNVLQIDPFGNHTVLMTLTGREFLDLLVHYSRLELDRFPHISGIQAELTIDNKDTLMISGINLKAEDGGEFDLNRTYIVATNSYITATTDIMKGIDYYTINALTSDLLIRYLKKKRHVDYHDVDRIFIRQEE